MKPARPSASRKSMRGMGCSFNDGGQRPGSDDGLRHGGSPCRAAVRWASNLSALFRYPRLVHATPEGRGHWEFIGGGQGIHWSGLDEDMSVEMPLAGRDSGESRRSFKQWLEAKSAGRGLTLRELTAHEQEGQRGAQMPANGPGWTQGA